MTNLRKGKYMFLALKDENNNYKFDPEFDKIGLDVSADELNQGLLNG